MKLIFDTDIGSDIDDALALLLLLHLPNVELRGVTTVYGNTSIRAKIARRLLDAAGVDVQVHAGESAPLWSPRPIWHTGREGAGLLSADELSAPLNEFRVGDHAPQFIAAEVLAHPGEVSILALGALTNVARALETDPAVARQVQRIFFMGGGVTFREPVPSILERGRSYRAAPSHNVRCDVRAAQLVFGSSAPLTILTNDVTTQAWWDGLAVQPVVQAKAPPEVVMVGRLLRTWLEYRSELFGRPITGTCPHDALTVAECVRGGFVRYELGNMSVNADGSSEFVPDDAGRHHAGCHVKADEFLAWLTPRLVTRDVL